MFSTHFLTCYCFFTTAIAAYRAVLQDPKIPLEEKMVASAFNRATAGLSKTEQAALLLFVLRLIQQPEEFSQNRHHRYKIESALDKEIAKQFPEIVNNERILIEADFLARAGLTKEDLSQKLREDRIFSIPEWVHKDPGGDYYPAFFVDPQYNLSSLEAVSMALRASPGARKYRFFTTSDPVLGDRTPLEVLASGKLECVVNVAKAFRKRTIVKLGNG